MKTLTTFAALGVITLAASFSAFAANKTWDGGAGAGAKLWSTGANWDADTVPSPGDTLFVAGSFTLNFTNDFTAFTAFGGLTYNTDGLLFSTTLHGNAISLSGGITNLDNSLQTINLDLDLASDVFISANDGTVNANLTINGDITDGGSGFDITKLGQRTLTLAGNNTWTGNLNIQGGTVQLNSATALNPDGATGVSISTGAALLLNGNSVTISSLSGDGTVNNNSATTAATLTINKTAGTDTFSGVIQNGAAATLAVTKSGGGTLVLSGANEYTGGTTISGGTLELGSSGALGNGPLDLAGGTMDAKSQTISIGALTLSATSILNLDEAGGASSLTFTDASFTGGVLDFLTINEWVGNPGESGTDDQIFLTGTVDADFLAHTLFQLDSGLYFATMIGTELVPSLTPVPEPTEWALIIFATLAVLYKFVLPRLRRAV